MALLDQHFGMQPQQAQMPPGLAQNILAQRFQPNMDDVGNSTVQSVIGKMPTPYDAMQQRQSAGMGGEQMQAEQLKNRMTEFQLPLLQQMMGSAYGMPQSGGNNPPVGFNQAQGGSTPYDEDPRVQKSMLFGMLGNKPASEAMLNAYTNDPNTIQRREFATKKGAQDVEDTVQARGTQDVVGIYNKLQSEATNAPSGLGENIWADVTNAANKPSKGAIARGGYDADMNNLYLGMIRSLKGTGRVMQAELDEIKNAQPKATDSLPVKQAKIAAHMKYYTNRMTELGYDPENGKPMGNNQLAPHNLQDVNPVGFPPSDQQQSSGLDAVDPRVQAAREHGYSDDEIRAYLQKGQ